jgi:hypothetical protein
MLSRETLERYRQMTPGERLALTLKMTEEAEPYLVAGTPEVVKRRFELLNRENDERNKNIVETLRRVKNLRP